MTESNLLPLQLILDAVQRLHPHDNPSDMIAVIEAFTRYELSDDLHERLRKGFPDHMARFWQLLRRRPRGTVALSIHPFEVTYDNGAVFRRTVVQIVQDDMPFLVDSLLEALAARSYRLKLLLHPVLNIHRDQQGCLQRISGHITDDEAHNESCIHLEIKGFLDEAEQQRLEHTLRSVFADVALVVQDWPAMRAQTARLLEKLDALPNPSDESQELRAFLAWLDNHHSTCLGYREMVASGEVADARLGLFRSANPPAIEPIDWSLTQQPADWPPYISILRSRVCSTVHRADRMFVISFRELDSQGKLSKVRQFIGLPPSPSNSPSPRDIPFLRGKIRRLVKDSGFIPQGYSSKALIQTLEQFPLEELLLADAHAILAVALDVVRRHDQRHIVLYHRFDHGAMSLKIAIFLKRERFTPTLENKIKDILADYFKAHVVEARSTLNEFDHALLEFTLDCDTEPKIDNPVLTQKITEACLTWSDKLSDLLLKNFGDEVGSKYAQTYASAFPLAYQEAFSVEEALRDIVQIQKLHLNDKLPIETIGTALRHVQNPDDDLLHLKIFHRDTRIALSDILPLLDNLDFAVSAERAFSLNLGAEGCFWIQDFVAASPIDESASLASLPERFHDAFVRIRSGHIENDGFNKLIMHSRLSWSQIVILRAYNKYLKQTGSFFSQSYIEEVLVRNAAIAELLIAYFEARFDPETAAHERAETYYSALQQALEAVTNLDDDRIIRRILNVLSATVRCSVYQRSSHVLAEESVVAFKFEGKALVDLPEPRPLYEIFIYSPRFEAVHLRGSKVARGGIRWSDRREDFRTEILGLLKAQIVKNAVIVPGGSKGGFVLKRTLATSDAQRAEAIACYTLMMQAMLAITDNLVDGIIHHPRDTVCYDGEDPYLVVAADKGTATFSDIANKIAQQSGFWLDDAFASGGSAGYDHKKMGITARGAWESVRHHCAELGLNADQQRLRMIGVGDMSGDVFGNGMLLSSHIALVGAFNHQHIFIDPQPDCATSFAERQRLFALPRSSWFDYDRACLSEGGGVFARSDKWITLTPAIRQALAIEHDDEKITPNALIQAMLRAPVDVIWFGGIGTFVKAHSESHHDVGDRANDPIRVSAPQLRCQIVAEGANLGVTQAGRIEFAARGGCVNTDAIDNSAGVDCSDHEVNIKILFSTIMQTGRISREERNTRLETMQDDVAKLVLRDNYQQNKLLAYEQTQGHRILEFHGRLIRHLEQKNILDRQQAQLPDDVEIARRLAADKDLTRPEIAVLVAHTKIWLCDELLASLWIADPGLNRVLLDYFPRALQNDFASDILKHPLRSEIITTSLVNTWVNRLGVTFIFRVAEATGSTIETIARALHATIAVHNIMACWEGLDALDAVISPSAQREFATIINLAIRRSVHWLIRQRPLLRSPEKLAVHGEAFQGLFGHLSTCLSADERDAFTQFVSTCEAQGLSPNLAQHLATLKFMGSVLDIVQDAHAHRCATQDVAAVYFRVGASLGFDWARTTLETVPIAGHWQRTARSLLHEDLTQYQGDITRKILNQSGATIAERYTTWQKGQASLVDSVCHLLQHMRTSKDLNLSSVDVLARRLRQLAES